MQCISMKFAKTSLVLRPRSNDRYYTSNVVNKETMKITWSHYILDQFMRNMKLVNLLISNRFYIPRFGKYFPIREIKHPLLLNKVKGARVSAEIEQKKPLQFSGLVLQEIISVNWY